MIKDKKEKQSGGSSSSSTSAAGASGAGSSSGSNSKSNNSSSNSNNNSSSSNVNASNTQANASSSSAGGNNNNSSTSSPSSSKTSSSSSGGGGSSSKSGSNNTNKNNILGIKEEIIEQGPTEQLIVTSIKHEDGSPPTNIIKKEPANSATTSGNNNSGSSSTSTVNSNDSNNNNDTNDNKNNSNLSNSGNLLPDEKDSANDNSITDELLNNDELNASGGGGGNNSSSSKLGMHIKSEDPINDPLGDGNINPSNFGNMNPQQQQQPGSNRPSMIPQSSPERIQPLPSNIINKQSNSMDYMQQQSQIFVFSTALANKGADAVRSGQFPTIIAYHCAQPETRKFLQKFPLKVNQFNRSGPGWFPPNMPPNMNSNKKSRMMPMNQQQQQQQQNFNFMKNNPMNPQGGAGGQQGPMNNQMGPGGMPPHQGPGGNNFQPSCDMNNELWGPGNHQMNMDPSALDPLLGDPIDSLVNDPLASNLAQGLDPSCMDPTSPNTIPSLQGVKVPDEDLTPQQRQQRALKLAQLQNLKQMFKQEHPMGNPNDMNQMNEQDSPMPGNGPPCSKMGPGPNAMNPMMQGGNAPGGMMNMSPHGPMNPGMNMNGPGPMRPNFPPGGPMGMGPRAMGNMNMNRPMGPNLMTDEMMSGGPCGGPPGPGMNNMMGGGGNMMGGMPQHMQPGPNNMGMGPGSCMQMPGGGNAGPMGMQKGNMPPGMGGNMHMDWNNKMQQPQYYDDNNKRNKGPPGMPPGMDMPGNEMNPGMGGRMPPNAMRNMPNMRGPPQQQQGPPPPYHQTPRSASVPIATQSPNPNSPNNPTSNLSLPSPRGNSALNSPAAAGDPSRMNPQQFKHMNPRQSPTTSSQDSPAMSRQINHSNPSTPISSHLSPSASLKDLEMSTNPNNIKEPNLMPVPSPQQISYLNTFEGQELTIQKQPNNNMNKDGNPNLGPDNRLPGQKTPTSTSNPHMNFSIPSSPHTAGGGDKNRLSSGPQNNLQRSNSMMGNDPTQFSNHPQGVNQQSNESNMPNMQFPDAPNMPFGPNVPQNKMPNFMDQKPGDGVVGPFPSCGGRPENLPLNPNSNAAMPNAKPSHFDPISSLAQMSQQLTSTGVPGPMNGQQMMGPFTNNGMMNEMGGPMGMGDGGQMDFGGNMGMNPMNPNQFPMGGGGPRSMSPKIGGPQMGFPPNGPGPGMRMVRPPMGYNGTNIQVKPNAPNTIQYLPARPQMNNSNPPRGPPSLEFLQRYTNPMGMDEMNKGAPNVVGGGGGMNPQNSMQNNMPYFPNQNNPNACGMVDPMDGNGGGPPPGMMNQNPMMMRGGAGGMRGANMNMRFPAPNNPCMMGSNNPQFNSSNPNMGNPEMMFAQGGPGGGGPNQGQNPQMFVAGPKSSPLPPPNSDMQMMGGNGGGMPPHFNKQPQQQQQQPQQSHFSNAANDPNYAQQYHNFQQQLYATNNATNQRNPMGGMGGGQAPPFMPK